MGFVKRGDEMPVIKYYEDGEEKICKKCGKPITIVAFKEDDVELICTCDLDEEETE
jgi:hypothetical protein